MKNQDEKNVARRDFIKTSAAGTAGVIIGLSSLSSGLKEAVAQARLTGKPLLTEEALNRVLSTGGANERSNVPALAEAKRDVKGFIRNRFTLTRAQDEQLELLSGERLKAINGLLQSAESSGGRLMVNFGRLIEGGGQPAEARKCEKLEMTLTLVFKF